MNIVKYCPTTFNTKLQSLFNQYSDTNEAISINFRKLVDKYNHADYYTHLIHPYPAKLLMHIPRFFLENTIFSEENDIVFDPFCGTGTVLLESNICRRNAIGIDSNPLAALISKVKLKYIDPPKLYSTLKLILLDIQNENQYAIPNFININYWFSSRLQHDLAKLKFRIESIKNEIINDFFLICFSKCIKKVSYADQKISVPVKLNLQKRNISEREIVRIKKHFDYVNKVSVFSLFESIALLNIDRIASLKSIKNEIKSEIFIEDARKMNNSELNKYRGKIQLIITSPPYAGAQKYIRASSHNLEWLELTNSDSLSELKRKSIGREFYHKHEYSDILLTKNELANKKIKMIREVNPLRSHICSNYLVEMKETFSSIFTFLKPGGYFILVSGNNTVCGYDFNTSSFLREIAENCGFVLKLELIDTIRSRGLMTKRNKTASMITFENVSVFYKGN